MNCCPDAACPFPQLWAALQAVLEIEFSIFGLFVASVITLYKCRGKKPQTLIKVQEKETNQANPTLISWFLWLQLAVRQCWTLFPSVMDFLVKKSWCQLKKMWMPGFLNATNSDKTNGHFKEKKAVSDTGHS